MRRDAVRRGAAAALAAASALALGGGTARANGRVPTILSVEARDDTPATIMLGATFGLVVTFDGGATWGYVCETALGYMGTFDPIFVDGSTGTWMATLFDGIARTDDGGCTWTTPGGTEGIGGWRSLVENPTVPGNFFAATGGDSGSFAVYASTDDGLTFAPTTLASPAMYYDGIVVSPVDPMRIYVGSWYPMPRQGWVNRSDDGGGSWTTTEHSTMNQIRLRVLGTSATDPDVVLWIEDGMFDQIWRSDDGGVTGSVSWDGEGAPFAAFTVAPDGTMYAANLAGVLVSSTDDGLTWNPAGMMLVTCLEATSSTVYACTNAFATMFAAMGSPDQGMSFDGLYSFADTDGPMPSCGTGTEVHALCDPGWPALRIALGIDMNPDGGKGGTDAGVDGDAGGADGGRGKPCGGGCAVAPGGKSGGGGAAGVGLALLALLGVARLRAGAVRRAARRRAAR